MAKYECSCVPPKLPCKKCYDKHRNMINHDKRVAQWSEYNKTHRLSRSKYHKDYFAKNRDIKLAYCRQWFKGNLDAHLKRAQYMKLHRYKRYVGGVSLQEWQILIMKYNNKCAYCGKDGARDMYGHLTMDHVIPLSRGGQHSINNILPACAYCNDSKGSKTSAEFKANEINR
jgi:5-methylcytosine-specific restriction endonuclease McrA